MEKYINLRGIDVALQIFMQFASLLNHLELPHPMEHRESVEAEHQTLPALPLPHLAPMESPAWMLAPLRPSSTNSTTLSPDSAWLSDPFLQQPTAAENYAEMDRLVAQISTASAELEFLDQSYEKSSSVKSFDYWPDVPSSNDEWSQKPYEISMAYSGSFPQHGVGNSLNTIEDAIALPVPQIDKPGKVTKCDTTGQKLISCEFCPKVFTRQYGLDSHMATHSQKRDFACPDCPSTFKRSWDLKRHQRGCQKRNAKKAYVPY